MKTSYAADEVQAFIEKNIAPARPLPSSDAEARRTRAEANRHDAELARKVLSAGGLDLERLDTLARERVHARRSRGDEQRRQAIEGVDRRRSMADWADAGAANRSGLDERHRQHGHVHPHLRGRRRGHRLAHWVTRQLGAYKLQPSSGAITKTGTGRLSFFILWRNPRSDAIVANVGPRVVVNAHLSVDADWNGVAAWFIGGSEARATVRARTTVWAMWNSSVQAIVSDIIVGSAGATGGFFGGDDSTSITINQFVPGSGFFVPAQAFVLIEVTLLTEYQLTSGSLDLDAASGEFKVSVPHLIITVT